MFKATAILSALMKVYTVPCHDRGHINVMLVLQSNTNCPHILPGPSSDSHATSSDGACSFSNIEVEEDIDVIEEAFIAINEEADISIKKEETPQDITFPDIKTEPDEVSYVCECLLLDTFYQCPAVLVFFGIKYFWPLEKAPMFGIQFFWGVVGGGRFCSRWVDLRLMAENIKIYCYLHVVKIPYPQGNT